MTNKLTFGYLYDFRNPPQWKRAWSDVYSEAIDFAAYTETLGFDGAWAPEHHGADDGYLPSPNVVLGAIAARTKTMRIGQAIALAPLYHPVRFAEECAVLDILSKGRLDVAVAIGYRKRETEAFGVDFTKRGSRTDEFLEIVTRLWRGETVSFEGKHFTVKNAVITPPAPNGKIPLFIGGFAEKAIARVAKYGDGYFGNMEICDLYAEKLRAAGKDPAQGRVRIQGLFIVVANDTAKAMDELAPYYHHVNNSYAVWMNEDRAATGMGDAMLKPQSIEDFKKSGTLVVLTPEKAIRLFTRMREKAPVEHFMMMLPPGIPPESFRPYAELFAKEVMPAFR